MTKNFLRNYIRKELADLRVFEKISWVFWKICLSFFKAWVFFPWVFFLDVQKKSLMNGFKMSALSYYTSHLQKAEKKPCGAKSRKIPRKKFQLRDFSVALRGQGRGRSWKDLWAIKSRKSATAIQCLSSTFNHWITVT